MDHLVKFTTDEGREGQHTADSLDDALAFVERLRNREAISEVRVFRVQEVPISFRTYFKVELAGDPDAQPRANGESEHHAVPPVAAPSGEAPVDAGRRLFSRS